MRLIELSHLTNNNEADLVIFSEKNSPTYILYVGKNMQSFSAIYYTFIRTYTIVRKVGVVARGGSLRCKDVKQFIKYSRR